MNSNSLYNYFSMKKEQKIPIIYITYCYNLSSLWLSESKEILLSHCSSVIICNESKFITNQSNNWYLYRCNIDRSIHSPGKMLQAYQNYPYQSFQIFLIQELSELYVYYTQWPERQRCNKITLNRLQIIKHETWKQFLSFPICDAGASCIKDLLYKCINN